MMTGFSVP